MIFYDKDSKINNNKKRKKKKKSESLHQFGEGAVHNLIWSEACQLGCDVAISCSSNLNSFPAISASEILYFNFKFGQLHNASLIILILL